MKIVEGHFLKFFNLHDSFTEHASDFLLILLKNINITNLVLLVHSFSFSEVFMLVPIPTHQTFFIIMKSKLTRLQLTNICDDIYILVYMNHFFSPNSTSIFHLLL